MSTSDFQRLIAVLSEANVSYVLIGGLAATIHGSAHLTYDVDICYERSQDNVERLCLALAPLKPTLRGAPSDLPFRLDASTVLAGMNFTLETQAGALDLLGEIPPFGEYSQVVPHSERAELFGLSVQVLSLDGLIQAKQATGRVKDRLIIPELEALRELKNRR